MQLFLIRHGETEHNIAGLLAGVTDSALTSHGVLQTQYLAKDLTVRRNLKFSQIFASDLQRAYLTAEELHKAQQAHLKGDCRVAQVIKLKILQEQDFGSLELVPWSSRQAEGKPQARSGIDELDFRPKETAESMRQRADSFLDDFITPLLALEAHDSEESVAVISHGLLLAALWRAFLSRFPRQNVSLVSDIVPFAMTRPLEFLPSWTNTGFLELAISPVASTNQKSLENRNLEGPPAGSVSPMSAHLMSVKAVNSRDHLTNLKRTRGGVGSATFDPRQKNLTTFFKKQRPNEGKSDMGTEA